MSDLISRQEALDAFGLSEKTRKWGGDHSGYNTLMLYEIQDVLEALPSAYPKKGKWKKYYIDLEAFGERPLIFYCSGCRACSTVKTDYCPNCGAYMEESE